MDANQALFDVNTIVHYSEGGCYSLAYQMYKMLNDAYLYGLYCNDELVHVVVGHNGYYYDIFGKFSNTDDILKNWYVIYEDYANKCHIKEMQVEEIKSHIETMNDEDILFVRNNLEVILQQPEFTADKSSYYKSIQGCIDLNQLMTTPEIPSGEFDDLACLIENKEVAEIVRRLLQQSDCGLLHKL